MTFCEDPRERNVLRVSPATSAGRTNGFSWVLRMSVVDQEAGGEREVKGIGAGKRGLG